MALSEQSQKIHGAFCTYVKTQDKKVIENFPREDIEFTLIQSNDIGWPHYKAMEMRVAELKEIEAKKNSATEHKFFKYKEGIYWLQIQEEYEISKKEFGKKINFVKDKFKRKIIFRDIEQSYILSKYGFNKPALILAGAVIEELLRLYLQSKNIKPKDNRFISYIECCEQNDLLKSVIRHQTTVARLFRNVVHLGNEKDKKYSISQATAKGAVASIFTVANDF
ncbi:MAG: hypothetical protein V1933_03695 [Candidatus Omnitrophota bacterium]